MIYTENLRVSAQHPSFVFSPLSLNAKLVGRLYESLAPAEREVRGCLPCVVSTCAWLHLKLSLQHPRYVKRLVVPALDQHFPLETWFHLLISCFALVKSFIHPSFQDHCCFCHSVHSSSPATCIETITVLPDSCLHLPAPPCKSQTLCSDPSCSSHTYML